MPTQVGSLIYSQVEMTQAIVDLLSENSDVLGLKSVFYGDTALTPDYPCAIVVTGRKTLNFQEAGQRFQIDFLNEITILHGKIQAGSQTQKEVEQFVEAVEAFLHTDYTWNNRIIFGHVTSIEPGRVRIGDVMMRAHRLIWEGLSKEGF